MKRLLLTAALTTLTAATQAQAFDGARFGTVAGHGGVPLNVVQKGEPGKPGVLFLHGFRQSYLSWSAQFGADLAKHCHLVAYDLRGHGNSGQPWQAAAYDNARPWADDMAAVIQASGLVKPLVVAWSFGGNVAMDFLRLHPEVPIAGLVLVASPAGLLAAPDASSAKPPRPVALDLAQAISGAERTAQLVFGAGVDAGLRSQLTAASLRGGPYLDSAVAVRGAGANADLLPQLAQQHVTLALGGRDAIVSEPVARQLRAALPTARVATFPQAGHALFLEDAAGFNALLDELHCSPGASR
ncbi:alpha/beta fold hydrolase [Roseateles cellulosilyticus]|uniref:Alpha/beta hydrolase n=1 Tax=Pelomonas cellulosilytica TaxID=2906762 RepID=A0ABS8XP35_9BURK|nr:alpha/beta hydrolase [Pelomonas sp. P8]MCE4552888.1 alpha/beta hydrolase [Pelomonas sp. P8]